MEDAATDPRHAGDGPLRDGNRPGRAGEGPRHDGPGDQRVADLLRGCRDVPLGGLHGEDPPPHLWAAIRDATRQPEGTGGAAPFAAGGVVEYLIDADDVVVDVAEGWHSFAEENQAPELLHGPSRRTLWSSIGDESLRDLWRAVVSRVRSGGRPVTLPFRCDGPSARRWFEMEVLPEAGGAVRFRSMLTFEMERPEVPALVRDHEVVPGVDAVEVCCWCAEAHDGERWRPVEVVLAQLRLLESSPGPPVRYGICPACIHRTEQVLSAGAAN